MKTKTLVPNIPPEEFAARATAMQKILASTEYDGILIFSTESEPAGVRYFSDYWPSFETAGVLIPRRGDPALIIGPESLTFARARSKIEKIIRVKDFRESSQPDYPGSRLPAWKEILAEYRIKKIGVAGWHMLPYSIHSGLAAELGAENIQDADTMFRKLTMRKSESELACLRAAAKISEIAFQSVLEQIKPGLTEAELAGIATAAMFAHGAEATGYPIWCCSGPNSIQAISRPTHRRVKEGEIVHFSIGAKVAGYSASLGRPVVLGRCPDALKDFMQIGLEAENLTIGLLRAGTAAAQVARTVHEYIQGKGYGKTILYGPAHGCGLMECEYPFVETSSDLVLKENMVFMVDIFLADQDKGFRWEDGVIVKNGEAEVLSSYKRQLNILEI